jgi:hypothetical protein
MGALGSKQEPGSEKKAQAYADGKMKRGALSPAGTR